jgi:hypothetical protein
VIEKTRLHRDKLDSSIGTGIGRHTRHPAWVGLLATAESAAEGTRPAICPWELKASMRPRLSS